MAALVPEFCAIVRISKSPRSSSAIDQTNDPNDLMSVPDMIPHSQLIPKP